MTEAKDEQITMARAIAAAVGWDFDHCPASGDPGQGRWTQRDFLDAAAVARARLDNTLLVKAAK